MEEKKIMASRSTHGESATVARGYVSFELVGEEGTPHCLSIYKGGNS